MIYFFREAMANTASKLQQRLTGWQGPAIALFRQGTSCLWASYGFAIMLLAPEQCRHATREELAGADVIDELVGVVDQRFSKRLRGQTTFLDARPGEKYVEQNLLGPNVPGVTRDGAVAGGFTASDERSGGATRRQAEPSIETPNDAARDLTPGATHGKRVRRTVAPEPAPASAPPPAQQPSPLRPRNLEEEMSPPLPPPDAVPVPLSPARTEHFNLSPPGSPRVGYSPTSPAKSPSPSEPFERSRSPKKSFKERVATKDREEARVPNIARPQHGTATSSTGVPDGTSLQQVSAQVQAARDRRPETPEEQPAPKSPRFEAMRATHYSRRAHIVYNALMHTSKAGGRKAKELNRRNLPGDPKLWTAARRREWTDWLEHDSVILEENPQDVDPELILPMRHLYVDKNEKAREEDSELEVNARARLIVPGFKDPHWQAGLVQTMAPRSRTPP